MKSPPRDEFEQVSNQIGELVSRLWQWHAGEFCPVDSWSPPINVYKYERCLDICVDLAGLDPKTIDVRVEPGRLVIRGNRPSPEPPHQTARPLRILAMEIDHGTFCRNVPLPQQVSLGRVTSEYDRGLLWIRLPLRDPG